MVRSQRFLPRVAAGLVLASLFAFGCVEAPEPLVEPEDRTLGTEIYLMFCEHVSGTLYPNDVRGRMTRRVCERGEPDPNGATRLDAMRKNRARIVSALDAILASDAYAQDELNGFVRNLIPLFDVPTAYLPNATDSMAYVVDSLRQDPEALAALERVSGRQGYRPLENALGTLTAVFRYPRLKEFLLAFTKEIQTGGVAAESWNQLMDAVGMELAVYAPVAPNEVGALDVTRDLLMSIDPRFASSAPSWIAARDVRGFVRANKAAAMGFVDANGDGMSDVNPQGLFVDAAGQLLKAPTPFTTLAEVEATAQGVTRNADGHAVDAAGVQIYEYLNADHTLLSGLSTEVKRWSSPDEQGNVPILGFMRGLPLILGQDKTFEAAFGNGKLGYKGFDTATGPLMGVFDFASLFLEAPELDRTLELFDRFMTEHEDVAAKFAKAMLAAKARADEDTNAHIEHPSNFWDETLTLLKRLAQRRLPPDVQKPHGDETALESLMRAMAQPSIRHMGGQIAMMGRHNVFCKPDGELGTGGAPSVCVDIDAKNINAPVIGKYGTRTDVTKPDLPAIRDPADFNKIMDGGNTSQLQAFLLLVGELMDRPLCNKATSGTALFASMASDNCSDYALKSVIGLSAPIIGGALGNIDECGFIKVPDMGRAFGQAMMNGSGDPEKEKLGLDLLSYINNDTIKGLLDLVGANNLRSTFDQIFKACSGVEEFDTTPTGPALARVLFAPMGSKTQIFGDQMFPPATLRPYVAGTRRDFNPKDGKSDFDLDNPPANLKLAEFFKGSLPVWEIQWQFGDSEPAGLMNSIVPMMYALNLHDFFPNGNKDKLTAGSPYFDTDQYLFNPLVGAFATHFPSKMSGYQNEDPNKPNFSYLSNLTSYQAILVDMLGEPDIKPNKYFTAEQAAWWNSQKNIGMFVALNDFLKTLDDMEFEGGRDGIDVMSELAERVLNPHVYCAPDDISYVTIGSEQEGKPRRIDGKGACDCDRDGDGKADMGAPSFCNKLSLRKPLSYRGTNGQDYVQWELGDKFDGADADHPWKPLAPVDLLLKSLNEFDVQFDANPDVKTGFRAARSEIIDTLFETADAADGNVTFANPHTVPMMRAMIAWGRAQVARHRLAPATDAMGKPIAEADKARAAQDAVRMWAATLPSRAESFMASPVMASALRFMADMQKSKVTNDELGAFMKHVFDANADPQRESFRPMILVLVDMLQILRDSENLPPIMRAAAKAFVPNVKDVLAGSAELLPTPSPQDRVLTFVHQAVLADQAGTLAKMMGRMVTLDPRHQGGKVVPLESLLDAIGEVNRAAPATGTPFNRADIESLLRQISEFLRDDKRGMARMSAIIQNRYVTPPAAPQAQPQAPQN